MTGTSEKENDRLQEIGNAIREIEQLLPKYHMRLFLENGLNLKEECGAIMVNIPVIHAW